MNVDILESNPYWWWYVPLLQFQGSQIRLGQVVNCKQHRYIPFAVGTMLITATVWIIFKLNPHVGFSELDQPFRKDNTLMIHETLQLEDKIEKEFRRLICGERPRVRR